MPRVLVVEDDEALQDGLVRLLNGNGYAADHVASGVDALSLVDSEPYSAMVLDVGLPDISGFEVLERLRRRGLHLPVLVLTARDTLDDRVRGLDAGGDDYLLKPFETRELLARLRALVRRAAGKSAPTIETGALSCDPRSCTATLDGRPLDLRRREWTLLYSLVSKAGEVVSRDRLVSEVFGFDDPVGPNAIEVYIGRLRKHLAPSGPRIVTLRGLGYMLDDAPPAPH